MTREDRLDALLDSARRASVGDHNGASAPPQRVSDAELAPLIEVARDLAPLATAQPNATFAANLRAAVLARAAARLADRAALEALPLADPDRADWGQAETEIVPLVAAGTARPRRVRRPSLRAALVAAALLLTLGGAGWGVAWAAATAVPGNPLYGLRDLGHMVQVSTASDSAGRAHLHLTYARELLASLRSAAQQSGGTTYASTLAALLQEESAAAQQISQVPSGAQRSALDQALATLRVDERATLQAVLPGLGWMDRLATTQVLGTLGVAVPQVTRGTVVPADHGLWTVTLSGSGFEPGATLLVNGHPAGKVTALTSTSLTAQVAPGLVQAGAAALGVSNPDGTAATTTAIQLVASPEPTATPGGNGGVNGNGGNGGGNGHGP